VIYSKKINEILKGVLAEEDPFILFGQNVSAGSCLSGLTRGLPTSGGLEMFNTPNCENAMVGFGFGMMMRGVNSAFVVKQHDFLLLTLDHMVNTYNMIKLSTPTAGFTIVCIVVDSGFEGPQSRLNNLSDFCSLADIDTHTINSRQDAEVLVPMLKEPGFRILALSQRLFRTEMIDVPESSIGIDNIIYPSSDQSDVLIISMNFSLSQAFLLRNELNEQYDQGSTVVGYHSVLPKDFSSLSSLLSSHSKVVIMEDSRSVNKSSDRLQLFIAKMKQDHMVYVQHRSADVSDISPNPDEYCVSVTEVHTALFGEER
jgi:pyruvate/2-oxoglutarate/acetoin dehydrogenase E1 component